MIAGLYGRLHHKGADHVIVDVQGVRYQCFVSIPTLIEIGEVGQMVELAVHTHVREDALQLFGFLDETEKAMFLALVGVSGIGPKLALTLLSGLRASELGDLIAAGDVARLTHIPGVGKKTAERIIVELRDKLAKLLPVRASAPAPAAKRDDELTSALVNLGYKPKQISAVVEKLAETADDATPIEVLIRLALKELSR